MRKIVIAIVALQSQNVINYEIASALRFLQ